MQTGIGKLPSNVMPFLYLAEHLVAHLFASITEAYWVHVQHIPIDHRTYKVAGNLHCNHSMCGRSCHHSLQLWMPLTLHIDFEIVLVPLWQLLL